MTEIERAGIAHELFTIGHSNHPIGRFVELLRVHAIELVCDVRSTPYSRFNPQFNREFLQDALGVHGIAYLFLGNQLGGKPRDADYPADDAARFALIGKSERFRNGLERLLGEAQHRRTAIMCAEKDPAHCHRGLLICPNLREDARIRHILADGSIQDDGEVEITPEHGSQPSLF
jgi:uncharacterized protein (DUF488 family)